MGLPEGPLLDWGMTFLGLLILVLAGDALVKGAVNLSLRLGVPALIVSLTIVAFGTSAPELIISINAILDDVPGIALGNVVGSNTANVLLVLGVPSLVGPIPVDPSFLAFDLWIMLGASLLLIPFVFLKRDITRLWGIVLTGLYLAYMVIVLT